MSEWDLSSGTSRVFDAAQLRRLAAEATQSQRQRTHCLFHSGPNDQVQRLVIAAQPKTYVRPHVHATQWEMLVLQAGRLDVLIFEERGAVADRHSLTPADPIIQIPMATWHACVVMAPDTAVLEIKPGPYCVNEFAAWAPPEGDPMSGRFVEWMRRADRGAEIFRGG